MTRYQKIFLLLVLALPFGLLLPFLDQFAYPLHSSYSDVTISHFPNLVYLQQSLFAGRGIPLWSDAILSGYPFFANPLSGMWYPPFWMAVFFKGAAGLNLVVLAHLYLGSLGMALYLMEDDNPFWAAILGGVAFGSMPKVFSHFTAGHVTMVCAVMWTPWLLRIERKRNSGGWDGKATMLSGIVLGLIALVDLRWAAYAGALWLAYHVWRWAALCPGQTAMGLKEMGRGLGRWGIQACGTVVIALGISAPQLVPLLRYSAQTTRELLSTTDNLSYALPAERLITLFFPDIGGYAEWVVYPGALMLLLFIWALMDGNALRKTGFWLIVLVLSGLYAFGEAFPLNRFIANLPGFSLLRVPSRAVFISNLALIVVASRAAGHLLHGADGSMAEKKKRYQPLVLTAVVMVVVILPLAFWLLGNNMPFDMVWGAINFSTALILLLLVANKKIGNRFAGGILLAVLVLDVGIVNHCGASYWPLSKAAAQSEAVAAYLTGQDGTFRVYSPSYSIPQHTAVLYGLQLADGIDPLQLKTYADYMRSATGVDVPGYSVTLPPFVSGQPARDNEAATPDAEQLGKLNVRFVAAEFDLNTPGLFPVARFGDTRVYENTAFYPRMWVQSGRQISHTGIKTVAELSVDPDRLRARAEGPGVVVASEIMYPGWKVRLDNEPATILTVEGLFRGVEIPDGEHIIEFYYQPPELLAGVGIGLLVWALIAGFTFYMYRKRA